jgi:hypothetical protein
VRILLLSIENKRSFKVSPKKLRFLGNPRGKSSHQRRKSSQDLPKFRRAGAVKSVETETNCKEMRAFFAGIFRKDHFLSMFLPLPRANGCMGTRSRRVPGRGDRHGTAIARFEASVKVQTTMIDFNR